MFVCFYSAWHLGHLVVIITLLLQVGSFVVVINEFFVFFSPLFRYFLFFAWFICISYNEKPLV